MTRPTAAPLSASPTTPGPRGSDGRLAGLALVAGSVITALGFLGVGFLVRAAGDARYTDPLWQPLYGVVLTGSVLVVLGLPAVLAVHGHVSRRLTLVGYVGLFAPLVMLNVAETSMEAFVKPYLAGHGGVPAEDPAGLTAFEAVALALCLVGGLCLAVAVFRGRTAPRWVGVALLASLVTVFVLPHTGAVAFVSDWCLLAALGWFGLRAARGPALRAHPGTHPRDVPGVRAGQQLSTSLTPVPQFGQPRAPDSAIGVPVLCDPMTPADRDGTRWLHDVSARPRRRPSQATRSRRERGRSCARDRRCCSSR